MRCPFCGNTDTKVLETRADEEASATRRRRACSTCGERFYTNERLDTSPLNVVKRDGAREGFDRQKLVDSLARAGKESIPVGRREALVDRIIADLTAIGPILRSEEIGNAVLNVLREVDTMTYARYGLFFTRPRDLRDFADWFTNTVPNKECALFHKELFVEKRSGQREPFDRRKLTASLVGAGRAAHRLEPALLEQIAEDIETFLLGPAPRTHPLVVTSQQIGDAVLARLREVDDLAYLSYATVFRRLNTYSKLRAEFASLSDKAQTATELQGPPGEPMGPPVKTSGQRK